MRKTPTRTLLILAAVVVAAGAAVRAGRQLPKATGAPVNVVLITLDTTRADRLSPYGFMDAPMPALERLAREGVVFDQAMSVAPLTLPAHTSLFTGLLPPRHGVRDNADPPLGAMIPTLAELLRARGVRTGAFVGSTVLDADRGLARGFDRYGGVETDGPVPTPQRRADAVATDAIGWLDSVAGSPFFLWAHFYDPHRPYDAPEPYRSTGADPYIAEIVFADAQIARLLSAFERLGTLEQTVIIVVADHGESLGDHGERDHGIFLYDSVMRVPLIIRVPGARPGRVADVVRITDLMPTMLELSGAPAAASDGVSLAGVLNGTRRYADLESYSESLYPQRFGWSPLRALRAGRFKFIEAPRPELYDLERDPFEQRNIHGDRPTVAAAMRRRLASMSAFDGGGTGADSRRSVTPDVQQRLAALGYIGTAPIPASASATYPDPKDCLAGHQARRDLTMPASAALPAGCN